MILTHAVFSSTCRTQRHPLSSQTSLPSNLNASTHNVWWSNFTARRCMDRGVPREEAAKTFSVSVPTIKRWLKRRRETGEVEPKPIPGRPPVKGAQLEGWLPAHLRGNH